MYVRNLLLFYFRHPNCFTSDMIDARDKEITRLNDLVMSKTQSEIDQRSQRMPKKVVHGEAGGDQVNLREKILEIQSLMQEKLELQKKLSALLEHQNETVDRILKLTDANKLLSHQLKEMERVALATESEANLLISIRDKEIQELKETLKEANRRITELEQSKSGSQPGFRRLHEALAKANNEKRKLTKEINEMKAKEDACCLELKRLKSRQSKGPSYQEALKERNELRDRTQQLTKDREHEQRILEEKLKTLEEERKRIVESVPKEIDSDKNRLERYAQTLEKENGDLRVAVTNIRVLLHQEQDKRKEAELKVIESQRLVDSLKEAFEKESHMKENQLSELQNRFRIAEGERAQLKERNETLTRDVMSKTAEVNNVTDNVEKLVESNRKLQRAVDELQNQLSLMNISSEEKITNIQTLTEKVSKVNNQSRYLENENGNLSEQNSNLQRQLTDLTDKLTKSLHDQRNALAANVQLEKALNEKTSSITIINNELAQKRRDLERFKQQLLELERQSTVKDMHSDAYEQQIRALQNRIGVLESLRDDADGVGSETLARVQGSINLVRSSSSNEDAMSSQSIADQKRLNKEVERFLRRSGTRSGSTSGSSSSKELLIIRHDLAHKPTNDLRDPKQQDRAKNITRRTNITKEDKPSDRIKSFRKHLESRPNPKSTPNQSEDLSSGFPSKFMQERLVKEQQWVPSDQEGYPRQISQDWQEQQRGQLRGGENHFHCCTLTHKIPLECNCVCVCLPSDYQLCCTEVTKGPPSRLSAGEATEPKNITPEPKDSLNTEEPKPKSGSDTSFYIDLLCESFGTSDELHSDYVAFEKNLFEELKYKRCQKMKKYDKKMFEGDKGSMILDKSNDKTSKEEFNNGMIQYSLNGVSDLPPPPPFPLPSEV